MSQRGNQCCDALSWLCFTSLLIWWCSEQSWIIIIYIYTALIGKLPVSAWQKWCKDQDVYAGQVTLLFCWHSLPISFRTRIDKWWRCVPKTCASGWWWSFMGKKVWTTVVWPGLYTTYSSLVALEDLVVVMGMAFSLPVRIIGEGSIYHSLPAFFLCVCGFFLSGDKSKIMPVTVVSIFKFSLEQ